MNDFRQLNERYGTSYIHNLSGSLKTIGANKIRVTMQGTYFCSSIQCMFFTGFNNKVWQIVYKYNHKYICPFVTHPPPPKKKNIETVWRTLTWHFQPHTEIVFTEKDYFQKIGRISASSHKKPLQNIKLFTEWIKKYQQQNQTN